MSGAAACLSGAALLVAFTGTTASAAPHVDRVSTAADGTQGDKASSAAVTTPNGRFVAFRSSATNLVPEGITHPGTYSYVRDLRTGEVTKTENALNTPRLSADGRWATYIDRGSRHINVFLTDLTHGTRTRVAGTTETVGAGPADSARDMDNPSLSGDGRLVAYQDDGTGDVWIADRATGTQTEVDDGTRSTVVQLSRLLLQDAQSNLWPLHGGHRELVGNGGAVDGSVSDRGRSVVYSTAGADVVPGDTNGVHDVFQWRSR
ncbi:TolB family protein [Streptomyces canus]|uniref:TolB family protein n=1 Tax=Streptomyces canus TaxID=58343 RepID=UPI0036A79D43